MNTSHRLSNVYLNLYLEYVYDTINLLLFSTKKFKALSVIKMYKAMK